MRPGGPSADFPDYIGVESCADMRSDADEVIVEADDRMWRRRKDEGRTIINERKEYPPLIPLLAQTENLHSHMPWVLTRHYTTDGRLILTEEKVRHHEYFQAHRHNGRLTLQLVPLDDKVPSYHPDCQCNDEYDDIDDVSKIQARTPHPSPSMSPLAEDQNEHFKNDIKANGQEDEGVKKTENGGVVGCGGGGGSKCLNYNSVGVVGSPSSTAGSCILGVPLPALSPVHS